MHQPRNSALRPAMAVWRALALAFIALAPLTLSAAVSPGTLQISSSTSTTPESSTTCTITVQRTGGTDGVVGVSYDTSNGTASAGSDYTTASGTLSWTDGDSSNKTITLTIHQNVAFEGPENFTVTLAIPTGGATLGAITSCTVTIKDTLTVTTTSPAPASSLAVPPTAIVVTCNGPVDAASVNASTVKLIASGWGTFNDGNEVLITPTGVSVSGSQITIDLTGVTMPNDAYRLTLQAYAGGSAMYFDGGGDLVTIPNSSSLNPVGALTLETWFKFESGGNWNPRFIDRDFYCLGTTGTGSSRVIGVGFGLEGVTPVTAGTWHHAAMTAVSGETWHLYLDGVLEDTITGQTISATTLPLFLGRSRSVGFDHYKGFLDEVRVWNVVRSQSEIQATMAEPLTGAEPGLVGYWRFDEASGQTVIDSSGNGNNGTLGSNSNVASDDPVRMLSTAPVPGIRTTTGQVIDGEVPSGTLPSGNGVAGGDFVLTFEIGSPTVVIAANDPGAGETGGNTGLFAVSMSRIRPVGTSVTLATSGTATSGTDYTAIASTAVIPAGATWVGVPVAPIADQSSEDTETVTVKVLAGAGYIRTPPTSATVSIADSPGKFQFDASTIKVTENLVSCVMTVRRIGGKGGAVSVSYTTANGTATAASDYTNTTGTLSWPDGDTQDRTITVPILQDASVESPETFTVTISNPTSGATLGTGTVCTATIDDDEAGVLEFNSRKYTATENGGPATITVRRIAGSLGPISVTYIATARSAATGADFVATTGTLSWASGDSANKTFTVPLINDGSAEPSESLRLSLSGLTGGASRSITKGVAWLTILDDDSTSVTAPWVAEDIGTIYATGSADLDDDVFTVAGAGVGLEGPADACRILRQDLPGDGEIVARITSLTAVTPAMAGITLRCGNGVGVKHASLVLTAAGDLEFRRRNVKDGGTAIVPAGSATAPVWLRMTRVGSTMTAATSADGVSWTNIGSTTLTYGGVMQIGLVVASGTDGDTASATFDNVTLVIEPAGPG